MTVSIEVVRRWRLLVLVNETVSAELLDEVVDAGGGHADVLVVAPALNGRLAFWSSDEARARREAAERLTRCLDALRACGVEAEGYVGDADPMLAIDDALRLFAADEIIVAAHPNRQANWLERGIVRRARARYPQPIRHVVAAA